ncbi:transcriptional adapter 3-B [Diabrotica virgifera virgifera]|uniref:Transcriptional adapter 3 n=1 Tax=Diabrotica virgifera virgifera TaxID=50390 RepID=A0ABM5L5Q8_DIAVI|nr:transcriptional adapter 3-B [Diabrotica virgifera virgifera]
MMNPKRSSHIAPKTNARHNGKLKEILQSVTYKQKCEPKVEEPDVFNVPVIRQNENCNLLPKYTSVLAKSGEDGISMVDLDMLQQDLEKLLSTSAVRIRYLLAEIGEIDKNCESPEKKTQVKTTIKRKHIDEKPKFKDFKVTLPKNNSDKFWASIEPFCASVTKDDMSFLESLIQEYSRPIDCKIPDTDEHYSNSWSDDSISEDSNPAKKKNSATNGIRKNGLQSLVESFSISPTQKLLAQLLEERVPHYPRNGLNGIKMNQLKDVSKIKTTVSAQKYGTCLDRRLKKELLEQGILTVEDLTRSEPEDEVLSEIKKCRQELVAVNEFNLAELNRLKQATLNDLHCNELKLHLEKLDKHVLDLYNKIIVTRKTAQQEEGDDFDKDVFCEQMSKEYENEVDELITQQLELNRCADDLFSSTQRIY